MPIRPRRYLLPATVAAFIAALLVWSALQAEAVNVGAVVRGTAREFVEEEGRTRVPERFELTAPVEGRLFRVQVEEGDEVTAGQVLAEMDPLALETRVKEAEARLAGLRERLKGVDRRRPSPEELERATVAAEAAKEAAVAAESELGEAKAAHEQARREAERARRLASEKTIPDSERETAELAETRAAEAWRARERLLAVRRLEARTAALSAAILADSARDLDWEEGVCRAEVEQVEAGLGVLRDDLRRAKVVSPVDGVVLRRYRESEAMVSAGAPVLAVGSLERLEVEADFLSEDAARMRPGLRAEVFGRAVGDRVLPASVSRVRPGAFVKVSSLGVEQQRTTVILALDPAADPGGALLGDQFRVDVRVIFTEKPGALLVPESALFRADGRWRVFRVDGGRARETEVETGLRDGRHREVLRGLSEGDRVVVHPDAALSDGTRVSTR